MISTHNITMQFGEKPLFENISIRFSDSHRYGLIGANGSGKSTFMRILTGELEPSAGYVSISPNIRIGKLGQDQFAFEDQTVIDTVIMGHKKLWDIRAQREALYAKPEMSEAEGMLVADLEMQFAEMDGYAAEAIAGELLLGAGIPLEQHDGPMSAVAPGWKLRVLLAQALFADPDILLLDEPTNHLDINTIRWLENILNQRNSTMVIISHDRHFLNSVCTHMADLDYGELCLFPGNYDEYMSAASQSRNRMLTDNVKKKAQIAELQAFVRRFSANASKARQATSRQRQIEKIKLDEIKPSSRVNPFIRFEQQKKLYRIALDVKNISKGFDDGPLFKKLDLMVNVGEKIAVIGPNGAGKTTLLRTLLGELKPDHGSIKYSENVQFGYFAQDNSVEFNSTLDVFSWMSQWKKPQDDDQVVRGVLGKLLFKRNDVEKPINVLSGGEQARMMFGKLILQQPNVLFFDEPTNHLDMESIESLNTALERYPGTIIMVSHDREIVSSIATRILEFTADGLIDYSGNYEEYLEKTDSRIAV